MSLQKNVFVQVADYLKRRRDFMFFMVYAYTPGFDALNVNDRHVNLSVWVMIWAMIWAMFWAMSG